MKVLHTCNVDAVLLGAQVNRGQAVLGLGVGIGLVLEEQVGHVHVALLGGQMQGREASLETGSWDFITRPKWALCLYLVLMHMELFLTWHWAYTLGSLD